MEARGIESETTVLSTRTHVDSRTNDPPPVDASARPVVDVGPNGVAAPSPASGGSVSAEDALAIALARAAEAGRWDVVAPLVREMEARRLARLA